MKRIAFITGATAGIGKATAYILAENGYNLIISGRRTERLSAISEDLQNKFSVKILPITLDVRNRQDVEKKINTLDEEWKKIDVLINNAGLALGLSTIQEGNLDDWETMIDTNIKGLLYVSRAVIPIMIQNKSGHIVNIGSIAGKETYLKGNVYCATKHAVDALTKSMRIDLLLHGIKVTAIHPGAVETEFSLVRYRGDQERADLVYKGFKPLYSEDVAEVIHFVISRPKHVNINDIIVMPTAQANTTYIIKNQ